MSETNAYMLEYAKSGRGKCTACKETIDKGDLRMGSPVEFHDSLSYKWRHWSCLTDRVLANMRGKVERHGLGQAVLGLDQLEAKDRARVQQALDEGVLEEASEPEEAAEEEEASSEEEEEKAPPPPVKTPKKPAPKRKVPAPAKGRGRKKGVEADEGGEEQEGHKPARKRAAKKA